MSEICLKILLIGDSFVGKTSLLLKYTEGKMPENHMATIGVEFKEKVINCNNRQIKLQIWDTSGQERFRSITQNFYRNADGIMVVFDVTNKNSFAHIKDWLTDVQNLDSDLKRILVANKTDLVDSRVINKEKMENFGENKNMKCYETSAKSGLNVDLIFQDLAELILADKTEEEIEERFTKTQNNLSISSENSENISNKKKKCC